MIIKLRLHTKATHHDCYLPESRLTPPMKIWRYSTPPFFKIQYDPSTFEGKYLKRYKRMSTKYIDSLIVPDFPVVASAGRQPCRDRHSKNRSAQSPARSSSPRVLCEHELPTLFISGQPPWSQGKSRIHWCERLLQGCRFCAYGSGNIRDFSFKR